MFFKNLFNSIMVKQNTIIGWYRLFLFSFILGVMFFMTSSTLAASTPVFNDSRWLSVDADGDDNTSISVITANFLSIKAGGDDLWSGTDQYTAYYLDDIEGDFEVTVKITSQTSSWGWQKAGLMIRDDMTSPGDTDSDGYFMVAATRDNGYVVQWDNNNNGFLDSTRNTSAVTYPCWLKLKKENKDFTGYYSTNGSAWVAIYTANNLNSAADIQDVGIFVSAVNITSHLMLTAQFEDFTTNNLPIANTYTIAASAGANGSISPSGDVEVTENNNQTFTITPDSGYEVASVLVDFLPASLTDNQFTFSTVMQNHNISVSFSEIAHTIIAGAGDNGAIVPSGTVSVADHADQTFSVTPNEGYEVSSVYVDGSLVSLTNDQYIFLNIIANHTISVNFTAIDDDPEDDTDIPGCSTNTLTDYGAGFDATDFDLANMAVVSGQLTLQTGAQAIDPENIVIPFTQEVSVTFLYEGAGYVSDFGWILYEDAVDAEGNFKGWDNIPTDVRHPIFRNIYDDNETTHILDCCGGGNGILDPEYGSGSFPTSDEAALAIYDDGTDKPDGTPFYFTVDGDGQVTPKDMKKVLGTFDGGTEIVFFLTADKDWDTTDTTGVFFTKKDWNTDTYGACGVGTFDKLYHLDQATALSGCKTEDGWLAEPVINRMSAYFGVTLSGDEIVPLTVGQKFPHVIVGAPDSDPNQWILGFEDVAGGGDADLNDMVFRIERRTGGTARLKSSQAIAPADADAYFTAVTFEVYDNMPCSGDTRITYYLSIDNGSNWVEITSWDTVKQTDVSKNIGATVTNWTYGSPQYTYRSTRVDFAGLGLSGRALLWKAELVSEDESCAPGIMDVSLEGSVASHGSFSRAEPIALANVLYSGSYETPAMSWTDKVQRGHLTATRLYDPSNTGSTAEATIWDAGTVLNSMAPSTRTIYFPNITVTSGATDMIGTGDGSTATFSGTLSHYPVSATTLSITDTVEDFEDKHTDVLEGDNNGTGTINRFTGAYTITFNDAPAVDVPIIASYSYYTTSSTLLAFNNSNVSNAMLGLSDEYIIPDGYTYDLDSDDDVDENDGDWLVQWIRGYKDGSSTKREWLLGAIDHSVPAIATPPGNPDWYYGTDITDTDRAGYDSFRNNNEERQTVIYIGARDGMLHAFDAGSFRWGDNPETEDIIEHRGYFQWEGVFNTPDYGTGEELWAFIPANLIPRLKNNLLNGDDQAYVDASPALSDVYINGSWKTVLLCAEGNGGDTVFALDVTDPDNPSFLWEYADPDLFRSRSSPAIAKIGRILVEGTTKWVAFFVSGKTYDATLYPSIYIIDMADGSVLQRVFLDVENEGVGGVPSGQPAIIDSDGNGYIDRAYIGTDKGFMYKVNIPDDPDTLHYTITHCVLNTDFTDDYGDSVPEAQRRHPIYASPTVTVDRGVSDAGEMTFDIKIFFGTGDSPYYDEDIDTSVTTYHFFAYSDQEVKGECGASMTLDWFYALPAGHRIFASAFAAAGQIYFGTSTSETEDPCIGTNEGEIFVLSIDDGSTVYNAQVGNIITAPVVEDKHLYIQTPHGMKSFGGNQYNTAVNIGGFSEVATRMWREIF